MDKLQDLKDLVEQMLAQNNIWAHCGNTIVQAYENRLHGGGIQCILRDAQGLEADIKVMEATPGYFTIAVVPCGSVSIDYSGKKTFGMTDSLETIRIAFPHGRNVNTIIHDLLGNH